MGKPADGAKKDVKKLIKDIRANGYKLQRKGGHIRVYDRNNQQVFDRYGQRVQFSDTPHGGLAVKRIRADLKRAGVLK